MKRRMAPFYKPLKTFNSKWTYIIINEEVNKLPLYQNFCEFMEEFFEVPDDKLTINELRAMNNKYFSSRQKYQMREELFIV